MSLPNALSWSRIVAAFVLPVLFYFSEFICFNCPSRSNAWFFRATLMAAVFLTDVLDGFFARRRNQQSDYGAKLDHVADKILVTALSIYFWLFEPMLVFWLVIPMLIREWGIALIRSRAKIPVQGLGKAKVWAQAISFTLLAGGFKAIGATAYMFALLLAYWSAWFYIEPLFKKAHNPG